MERILLSDYEKEEKNQLRSPKMMTVFGQLSKGNRYFVKKGVVLNCRPTVCISL